jgi:hypothetical protein
MGYDSSYALFMLINYHEQCSIHCSCEQCSQLYCSGQTSSGSKFKMH